MRGAVAAALVLALAAVTGCGGGGDTAPATVTASTATAPSTSSDQTEVEPSGDAETGGSTGVAADDQAGGQAGAQRPRGVAAVIAAVLTGSVPAATICDELVTPRYVRTAYGDRTGCVAAQRAGSLARDVRVEDVRESTGAARAVVVPSGGTYDGIDVRVELVPATGLDGVWTVDSLVADVPAGP